MEETSLNDTKNRPLHVLGQTSFLRGYEIDIEVICCYCVYNHSGDLFFSIRDWFRDPIDIGIELGGTPYRIKADWSEKITGGGRLLNCR